MTEIEQALEIADNLSKNTFGRTINPSEPWFKLLADDYREQKTKIKKLEDTITAIKQTNHPDNADRYRIAVLELALKRISQFSQDEWIRKEAHTIIFNSKLGELFQALLEEHNSEVGSDESGEAWEQVEALRKQVGL